MTPTILALAIAPPIALLVGLALGYRVGLRAGHDAKLSYIEAVLSTHAREIEVQKASGGPCWVRGQIPTPLADPPGGPHPPP